MNPLLEQISADLTGIELAVLKQVNPHGPFELLSLVKTYPELASLNVRLPHLSAIAIRLASEQGIELAVLTSSAFSPELGALQPNGHVRHSVGHTLSLPPDGTRQPASGHLLSGEDIRLANWPVLNQHSRGTCVAFAANACLEIKQSPFLDLSEQFLYWVIKDHHDGQPNLEGTSLNFAKDALLQDGVCTESLCRYSHAPIPSGRFRGGPRPPISAFTDAITRKTRTTHYQGGSTTAIHASLVAGKPVAMSLPVFASSSNPNQHNWNSPIALRRGVVINPPPTATVVGAHAVCVTGFVPDTLEPNGGYFVIRNSWGSGWGVAGTPENPRNPEPGYGSISATYVELYAWEWLNL